MFGTQSFLFGGNTGETPETIKAKRELIARMIAGQQQPQNWGQGLGAILSSAAAGWKRRRAEKAEAEGKKGATDAFTKIFSGISGGGSSPVTASPEGGGGGTGANVRSVTSAPPPDMSKNEIFGGFMDTVKTKITNPYGLAAVAATGDRESKWAPGNVNRTWSDPSQSGKAGTAGGILSWRGPRLAALQKHSGGTNGTPQQQAEFFLQENPALVEALNKAKSPEEAMTLMNNAWAFAGHDNPNSKETRARYDTAVSYAPMFQGQPTPASTAIDTQATPGTVPMGGPVPQPQPNVIPMPEQSSNIQGPRQPEPVELLPKLDIPAATPAAGQPPVLTANLLNPSQELPAQNLSPVGAALPSPAPTPTETAENASTTPPSSATPPANLPLSAPPTALEGPSAQELIGLLQNPWLNDSQKAVVSTMLEQKLKQPEYSFVKGEDGSLYRTSNRGDVSVAVPGSAKGSSDDYAVVGSSIVKKQTGEVVYTDPTGKKPDIFEYFDEESGQPRKGYLGADNQIVPIGGAKKEAEEKPPQLQTIFKGGREQKGYFKGNEWIEMGDQKAAPEEKSPQLQTIFKDGREQKGYFKGEQWIEMGDQKAEKPKEQPKLEEIFKDGKRQKGYRDEAGDWHDVGGQLMPGAGMSIRTINPDGSETVITSGNQGAGGKAPTEYERKLDLFGSMQEQTGRVINDIEKVYDPANITDAAAKSIPIGSAFFTSAAGQKYNAAANAWAEGALRIATGQAAQQSEIDRIVSTYFAKAGDLPETIKFKSQLRDMYFHAMKRSRGTAKEGDFTLLTPTEFLEKSGLGEGTADGEYEIIGEEEDK